MFHQAHRASGSHCHGLRHTFISLMISKGIDIVTVSTLVGHSMPSTTIYMFAHAVSERNESVQNIKLLGGSAPTVSMEQLAYDCQLMNTAFESGKRSLNTIPRSNVPRPRFLPPLASCAAQWIPSRFLLMIPVQKVDFRLFACKLRFATCMHAAALAAAWHRIT